MKIESRSPHSLERSRFHSRHVPTPDKQSPEWIAFVNTVRNDGRVRDPVRGSAGGLVFDGWWRVKAAQDLQLESVPYEVVPDHEEALLIVESLTARKHMQVSGRVYLAIGLLEEYATAAEKRRLRNAAEDRKTREEPIKLESTLQPGALRFLGERFGCSHVTIQKAKQLRAIFHDPKIFTLWLKKISAKIPAEKHEQLQADLRAEFEPLLFNASKSLWDVLQAIAGRLTGQRKGKLEEQLDLFTGALDKVTERFEYWDDFDGDARRRASQAVSDFIVAAPEELRDVMRRALKRAGSE